MPQVCARSRNTAALGAPREAPASQRGIQAKLSRDPPFVEKVKDPQAVFESLRTGSW
jgi:hypothetical protein